MDALQSLTARELVPKGLDLARELASRHGIESTRLRGKLLRPRTALAFAGAGHHELVSRERFWMGCLAVQLAHEASLHHDDVLDHGDRRRNTVSLMGARGAGAALLAGDRCLAQSYRIALLTQSQRFSAAFAEAVDATILGESMQQELSSQGCTPREYESIVRLKAGALFGVSAGLAGWLGDGSDPLAAQALGVEIGALYQLVDDFLDYCPSEETGKPDLQDFRNRVWTSVLGSRGTEWFDRAPGDAVRAFFLPDTDASGSMAQHAVDRLRGVAVPLLDRLRRARVDAEFVQVIADWLKRCERAVERATDALGAA